MQDITNNTSKSVAGRLSKKTIMVFSPHPDDETLGCGGTIMKKVTGDYNVFIVEMTDGKHALSKEFGILRNPSPQEVKHIRRNETLRAMTILGVPIENVIFLNFEDGMLANFEAEARAKVSEILDRIRPEEVYYPFKKDHHTDHIITNKIVRQFVETASFPISGYQYSIFQRFSRVATFITRNLTFPRTKIFSVDISVFVQQKLAAINEFKSQTEVISTEQKWPVLRDVSRFLDKRELFYLA